MTTTPEPAYSVPSSWAGGQASVFRTTCWSAVRLAQADEGDASRVGMERLAKTYWYPLYAFARRQGVAESDAQDLTQGFLTRLVTGNLLHSVDASKGRFRSFLLACYKNYLADDRERSQAVKRGGGVEFVTLDTTAADERFDAESVNLGGEEHYDRDWAQSLMSEVLHRLRLECVRTRKLDRFDALLPFLLEDPSELDQIALMKALNLGESGLRTALQRFRFRFGEFVWTEIAQTVSNVADVEEETRHVLAILSRTDVRPVPRP